MIRKRLAAAVLVVSSAAAVPLQARGQRGLEYDVKGQFLLHFTGFIDWPAAAFPKIDAPFRLCILGTDPFGATLDARVQGETIGGRRISVDRIKTEEAAASCQVVFLASTDRARAQALDKATRGRPVLIVSDSSRLLEYCAAIAFVLEGGRVRFDVNLTALASRSLRVSPRLLRVARDATDRLQHCD